MKRLAPKRVGLITIGVIVVLAIAYGFLPKAIPVESEVVERGPMEVVVEEEGQTRVIDRFLITAPVSGFARRLELEVGDAVEEGAAVLRIEPLRVESLNPQRRAEAQARVAGAQSALQSAQEAVRAAEADAELANTELERLRRLFDADAATQRELDYAAAQARRADAQKASSQFSVEVAGHNLDAARTTLNFAGASGGGKPVVIKSPVAGRVLAVYQESEGVVGPGSPLLEVGDPDRLEVAIDVLSQDATRLEPGMDVRFERWGGGEKVVRGTIRTVEPVGFTKISALGVEEQRVWVVVDFTSPPESWNKLGDGYRVVAEFIVWQSDDVLQIPSSALFRKGDGWAAFAVDGGRSVEQAVTIGLRSGLRVQIIDGLAAGQEVIVHPASEIDDGSRVKIR